MLNVELWVMNEVVNSEIVILIRILNPASKKKACRAGKDKVQRTKDKVWKVMNDEI